MISISESDIGFALLNVSITRYCNPRSKEMCQEGDNKLMVKKVWLNRGGNHKMCQESDKYIAVFHGHVQNCKLEM